MATFVFWNLNRNPAALPHLACTARSHAVDVFLLAECVDDLKPALKPLNALGTGVYREADYETAKVRAVTRLGPKEIEHRYTSIGRELAIWSVRAPKLGPAEVLLAGAHLPSKFGGASASGQLSVAEDVIEELCGQEDAHGHCNTVFVGDFNMHPYDPGMTSVTGIHGLMTRELAGKSDRVYRNRPRRRFFNPMWGLFGDRTPGPAGTFFWRSSVPDNPHWAMLDQVLLRPALIDRLTDLRVLDDDGPHPLTGPDGAPDRTHLSDHLPVLFRLDV